MPPSSTSTTCAGSSSPATLRPGTDQGRSQRVLGAMNGVALAKNFARAGFDVVVADVLDPETAALWRASGLHPLVVRLVLSLHDASARAATRPRWITDAEFRALHEVEHARPPGADVVLDVCGMGVQEQVAEVEQRWRRIA